MTIAAALGGLRARWLRAAPGEGAGADLDCRSTSRTHVGLVRSINEDRVLDRPDAGLWAVIDGMGGHAAGDLAAEAALHALDGLADAGRPSLAAVEAALAEVNRTLYEQGRAAGVIRGATAVVLVRGEGGFAVCWVGDCRAYRQRGTALVQLTRDHSVVQELVDSGQLRAEDAAAHPRGNVVTRALGAAATVTLDTAAIDVAADDVVLLCSDGLTRGLAAPPVAAGRHARLAATADHLLATALERDGSDNISLVLVACAG